jgi:hypothetical protein
MKINWEENTDSKNTTVGMRFLYKRGALTVGWLLYFLNFGIFTTTNPRNRIFNFLKFWWQYQMSLNVPNIKPCKLLLIKGGSSKDSCANWNIRSNGNGSHESVCFCNWERCVDTADRKANQLTRVRQLHFIFVYSWDEEMR